MHVFSWFRLVFFKDGMSHARKLVDKQYLSLLEQRIDNYVTAGFNSEAHPGG
jgi:hypothetical protein